jgi:hypothetical protein
MHTLTHSEYDHHRYKNEVDMVNVYIQFKLLYNALYSSRINFGELKLDMRGTEDK